MSSALWPYSLKEGLPLNRSCRIKQLFLAGFPRLLVLQLLLFLCASPLNAQALLPSEQSPTAINVVQPSLVRDISNLGAPAYVSASMATENGFFVTVDERELWFSDGTTIGTRKLAVFDENIKLLDAFSGGVLFGTGGLWDYTGQLWYSDGTVDGTKFLAFAQLLAVFDDSFLAWRLDLCSPIDNHYELLLFESETLRYRPVGHFVRNTVLDAVHVARTDDHVYFVGTDYLALDGTSFGRELWQSDGTPEGTHLALDLVVGPDNSDISTLIPTEEGLYFIASDGAIPSLWEYDPQIGAAVVRAPMPELANLAVGQAAYRGHEAVFAATADLDPFSPWRPYSLWYLDGRKATTEKFADLIGDTGWTTAWPKVHWIGHESNGINGGGTLGWWLYDVDARATTELHVFERSDSDLSRTSFDAELLVLGDRVLAFTEQPRNDGFGSWDPAVWTSDGTVAGTTSLLTLPERPLAPVIFEGIPYFYGFDGRLGFGYQSLHVDTADIEPVFIFDRGTDDGYPRCFFVINERLFFTAYTPSTGVELWISDGTSDGTRLVADGNPSRYRPDPWSLLPDDCETPIVLGDQVLRFERFVGSTAEEAQVKLWSVDARTLGVENLHAWTLNLQDSVMTELFNARNHVYFAFALWMDGQQKLQWWASDGSASGTRPVVDEDGAAFFSTWPLSREQGLVIGDDLYLMEDPHNVGQGTLWRIHGDRVVKLMTSTPDETWRRFATESRLYVIQERWMSGALHATLGVFDPDDREIRLLGTIDGYDVDYHGYAFGDHLFLARGEFPPMDSGMLYHSDGTSAGTGVIPLSDPLGESNVIARIAELDDVFYIVTQGRSGPHLYRWSGPNTQAQRIAPNVLDVAVVDGRMLATTAYEWQSEGSTPQMGWLNTATGTFDTVLAERSGAIQVWNLAGGQLLIQLGENSLYVSDGTIGGTHLITPVDNTVVYEVFVWAGGISYLSYSALWHSSGGHEEASVVVQNEWLASDRLAVVDDQLLLAMQDPSYGVELFRLVEGVGVSATAHLDSEIDQSARFQPLSVENVRFGGICEPVFLPYVSISAP